MPKSDESDLKKKHQQEMGKQAGNKSPEKFPEKALPGSEEESPTMKSVKKSVLGVYEDLREMAIGEIQTFVQGAGDVVKKYKSKSNPGKSYEVKKHKVPFGRWKDKITCDCKSYIYRGYCRHVIENGNGKAKARRKAKVGDKAA